MKTIIKGHTFVEMTVVIVVLGLVALFMVPIYGKKVNWGSKYRIVKNEQGMARSNLLSDNLWFQNKVKGIAYSKSIEISNSVNPTAMKMRLYEGDTATPATLMSFKKDPTAADATTPPLNRGAKDMILTIIVYNGKK